MPSAIFNPLATGEKRLKKQKKKLSKHHCQAYSESGFVIQGCEELLRLAETNKNKRYCFFDEQGLCVKVHGGIEKGFVSFGYKMR